MENTDTLPKYEPYIWSEKDPLLLLQAGRIGAVLALLIYQWVGN